MSSKCRYTLKLKHHFDAAHFLYDYVGKCANEHGHRWEVLVEITTSNLNKQGMVIDFTAIKKVIDKLDHCVLNDHPYFSPGGISPTAENIAQYLYDDITVLIRDCSLKVTIWESPNASITYEEEGTPLPRTAEDVFGGRKND